MSRLENWYIQTFPDGERCLWGDVYEDDRFADGKNVRTSLLQEINIEEGWAKTLNTEYKLGAKHVPYDKAFIGYL